MLMLISRRLINFTFNVKVNLLFKKIFELNRTNCQPTYYSLFSEYLPSSIRSLITTSTSSDISIPKISYCPNMSQHNKEFA